MRPLNVSDPNFMVNIGFACKQQKISDSALFAANASI